MFHQIVGCSSIRNITLSADQAKALRPLLALVRRSTFGVCMAATLCWPMAVWADTTAGLHDFEAGRFAEAMQQWKQSADAGDARGALYIGVMYDTGQGVPQNYTMALEWYRRAAEAGNAAAAFNVGVYYDSGLGVAKDRAQAANWYERAAARGFARANYNLALLYTAGDGVPRDDARANKLFTAAARQGISAAWSHVERQTPRTSSPKETQDVATREFQQAQTLLLERGTGAAAKAVALFRRAADQGDPLAQYDLGYCYEHGIGVARDLAVAGEWYRRAAAHANDILRVNALNGIRNVNAALAAPAAPRP